MTKKQLWKKIKMTCAAGGVMAAVLTAPMAAPTAQAAGWGDLIGGIIGVNKGKSHKYI